MMFRCEQCGACCRNLNKSPIYAELDTGGGVCKYLRGNLCSIYDSRPLLCRIDACYEVFFKTRYSLEEYYQLNYQICRNLKQEN